ncbi:hypothetical protein B0H14DRAFT_3502547 [Mycena olivaceomarginata]|nr:hypothetical protein B0H14DRAFT_3502547 [Mycena olivaceomarginata]
MAQGKRRSAARNSASDSTATTATSGGPLKADWLPAEGHALLDHLLLPEVKAKAGDGGNFLAAIWTEAAVILAPNVTRGAPKTAKVCKNKYGQFRATLKIVEHVAGNSGWHWSDENGANIDATTKSTWDDYVKAHPKAHHYRNRGWEFRWKMLQLTAGGIPSDSDDDENEDGEGEDDPPVVTLRNLRAGSPDWNLSGLESGTRGSLPTVVDRTSGATSENNFQGTPIPPVHMPAPSVQNKCPIPATPVTPAPPSKKMRGAGPAALTQIASSLSDVGDSIRAALAPPDSRGLEATPRRKMAAIVRAQQLESDWLPEDQMIRFIDILKSDKDAVDAYSVLGIPSLRKGWVRTQLGIEFEFNLDWLNQGTA